MPDSDAAPTTENMIAVFFMISAAWGSLLVWWRTFQNTEGRDRLIHKLLSPPDRVGQITLLEVLGVFLIWVIAGAVYGTIWKSLQTDPDLKMSELSPYLRTLHLNGTLVVQLAAMLGVLWLGSRLSGFQLRTCGFHFQNPFGQVKAGWLGFLLSLIPVYSASLITSSLRTKENMHPLLKMMDEGAGVDTLVMIGFSAIVLAPLVEELLFRVCIQGFAQQVNTSLGIILPAVLFAVVHGFPDSLPLIPLALVLGTLYFYTRSYWACVVMHALFNAFNYGMGLLSASGS